MHIPFLFKTDDFGSKCASHLIPPSSVNVTSNSNKTSPLPRKVSFNWGIYTTYTFSNPTKLQA